ncbi:MAG: hypothetical protein K9H16_02935 [Bacteroidales bacterium]|nr:hypothetical protein [Bacteroidales bacterium]
MRIIKAFVLVFPMLILTACPFVEQKIKYPVGHVPQIVTNFEAVNSMYDDYNSDLHMIFGKYFLQFSSNKNSMGSDYDIVGRNLLITWDQQSGNFDLSAGYPVSYGEYMQPMLDSLNTACDELGPNGFGFFENQESYDGKFIYLLMFANDCSGDFEIQFNYTETNAYYNDCTSYIHPCASIDFVNTEANELYPALFGEDVSPLGYWYLDTDKFTKLIFCSDRAGHYDLFEAGLPSAQDLMQSLVSSDTVTVVSLPLNSSADDKCPFVYGNIMVFVSDREGGFGGFDLYFSKNVDGEWIEPQNMGLEINTEFDEYRPIISALEGFDNSLLIFSSNRPGGLGGFDLYYAGISFGQD